MRTYVFNRVCLISCEAIHMRPNNLKSHTETGHVAMNIIEFTLKLKAQATGSN